jgi:hypothetical protein
MREDSGDRKNNGKQDLNGQTQIHEKDGHGKKITDQGSPP